jgi:hypothetical protein
MIPPIGVLIRPGETAFIRIGDSSSARLRASDSKAAWMAPRSTEDADGRSLRKPQIKVKVRRSEIRAALAIHTRISDRIPHT